MMTGFDWPLHVNKIVGDTGRVRDFLTTRPEMRGNASVALDMHESAASARPFPVANRAETANMTAIRIRCVSSPVAKKLEHRISVVYVTAGTRSAWLHGDSPVSPPASRQPRLPRQLFRSLWRGCETTTSPFAC